MHSVIIACTITTLITTYIYIASFKVQLSQQLHCSVSYRWGYLNTLTASATATLVHAFVANRLDYCSSLYAGLPACRLACLDQVLHSAARVIGGIPKFGHVSKYKLDVLRWLPAEQRISYRIASLVWRCLLGLLSTFVSSVVLSLVL